MSERQQGPDTSSIHSRIWARDHTLWKDNPTEISDRLGWLDVIDDMVDETPALTEFASGVAGDGFRHIVLLGMGGSSLGPEVLRQTLGSARGYPELTVLDSTDPEWLRAVAAQVDIPKTLFLVSSKSGTTTEPLVLYAYFRGLVEEAVGAQRAGGHFVTVTDPGTPLADMAREQGFRRVFTARPDIGGRYSVLSHFGLVPAALMGVDLPRLLAGAGRQRDSSRPESGNPPPLGAYIAEMATRGRDKLSILAGSTLSSIGLWIEQLIAESTGKEGRGVTPIASEPVLSPDAYGGDRAFVLVDSRADPDQALSRAVGRLRDAGQPVFEQLVEDPYDIGKLFFEWEFATAEVGARLGINPFDQPNVQAAKDATTAVLGRAEGDGARPALGSVGTLGELLAGAQPGDYLAITPFVQQSSELDALFATLRRRVMEKHRIATTLGYGPRFLHSTGQLHKGGPDTGLFLQITRTHGRDTEIPGYPYTFGTLIDAQAVGDFEALTDAGRRVARIHTDGEVAGAVRTLIESV